MPRWVSNMFYELAFADDSPSKIYIRTKHAWYILDSPSPTYHMFFSPFWVQHRLLHLLINSSLENPRLTYTEFIENLQSVDESDDCGIVSSSYSILNRGLHEEDLKSDDVVSISISQFTISINFLSRWPTYFLHYLMSVQKTR